MCETISRYFFFCVAPVYYIHTTYNTKLGTFLKAQGQHIYLDLRLYLKRNYTLSSLSVYIRRGTPPFVRSSNNLVLYWETSTVVYYTCFNKRLMQLDTTSKEKPARKKKLTFFIIPSEYIRILFLPAQTKYQIDRKIESVAHVFASISIYD